jgi:broad specificity phosphatase PhoE
MKIYYARHTDADDDRRDSFGGISDDALIQKGKDYAEKVGPILSKKGIDAIFSSPYLRAFETAEIINKSINVEIHKVYNLRERNSYGVLSGIEKSVAKKLFPSIVERITAMKSDGLKPSNSVETLPGAEIYLDLLLRAKDAFKTIFREAKILNADKVLIVTHGGFSSAFFKSVLGVDIELSKGEIVVLDGNSLDDLKINTDETNAIKNDLT